MTKLSDALNQKRKPVQLRFQEWLDSLDADDRKEMMAAAADHELSNSDLFAVIKSCGVAVAKETVTAWRSDNGLTR